jgi:hypothetical protein
VTGAWKLIVALAAALGVGTCVALGFLAVALFVPQQGTLQVLDTAASERDVLTGDFGSMSSDVQMENARFLGMYENTKYFAAPSAYSEASFCLIAVAVMEDGGWEAACGELIDGRDVLTYVWDADGREVVLVPDQFDKGMLEVEGWVSVHQNVMVQVDPDAPREFSDERDDVEPYPVRA